MEKGKAIYVYKNVSEKRRVENVVLKDYAPGRKGRREGTKWKSNDKCKVRHKSDVYGIAVG